MQSNPNPSSPEMQTPNPAQPMYTPQPQFMPQPPYMPQRPKLRFDLDRRDRIFAVVLFILTLLDLSPAILGGGNAAFGAAIAVLFTLFSIYLRQKGSRPSVFSCLCGVLAFASSAVFFLTSGPAIRLLTACSTAVLSVVWFCAITDRPIFPGELGLAERVLLQIAQSIVHLPHSVAALFRSGKRSKVLLGLLCALPVLCIVLALLARSDAAFEGLTRHLFVDFGRVVSRVLLAVLMFPFLLSLAFSLSKTADKDRQSTTHNGMDTGFIAAFLGVLSAAYLVYLFSQLAYFVSAFSGILPEGYTFSYAEYARRGFFELCGIAAINLTILYLTLLLSRKQNGKLPVLLRVLGTFVDVFTLFLICTAMAKMVLYIRQYGTTVLRLGTSAFMLFMAVVFLALLVRFYTAKLRVLPVAAVTAAVILLVLGIGNLHGFCAKYNYTQYQNGNLRTVDTAYLRQLGDEGIPYLLLLRNDANKEIAKNACIELYVAVCDRYEGEDIEIKDDPEPLITDDEIPIPKTYFMPTDRRFGSIYQMNLPRKRAYDALDRLLKDDASFMRRYAEEGELHRYEYSMLF